MIDPDLYRVLEHAFVLHKDQLRDDGQPYITHPVAVAMILSNHGLVSYNHIATALLHDVLEDTVATYDDVLEIAGSMVVEYVQLLTKRDDQKYSEYYKGIRKSGIAVHVK